MILSMEVVHTKIGNNGLISIPEHFFEKLGMKEGDSISISLDGEVIRVSSRKSILDEFRSSLKKDGYTVDNFLQERRSLWGENEN